MHASAAPGWGGASGARLSIAICFLSLSCALAKPCLNRLEEAGFLNAIHAVPDEDTVRLVFADYLQEQGASERAELIRVQIAMARAEEGGAPWSELWRRERALLATSEATFVSDELASLAGKGAYFEYRRGFIDEAILSQHQLIEHLPELVQQTHITKLKILLGYDLSAILAHAYGPTFLKRLRHLNVVRQDLGDIGVEQLANCRYLSGLKGLNLGINGLGPRAVQALAESTMRLEKLELWANPILNDGVETIAESPAFSGLTLLDINFCGFGSRGARALVRSRTLQDGLYLDHHGNNFSQNLRVALRRYRSTAVPKQ